MSSKSSKASVACLVLVLVVLSGGRSDVSAAAGRPVDNVTGCPKDGKYSAVFAVLIDTTDSLVLFSRKSHKRNSMNSRKKFLATGKLKSLRCDPRVIVSSNRYLSVQSRASKRHERVDRKPALDGKEMARQVHGSVEQISQKCAFRYCECEAIPIMEEIQQVSAQAFFETPPIPRNGSQSSPTCSKIQLFSTSTATPSLSKNLNIDQVS